ncbi:MAG: hypothetical protein ABIG61_08825 [Planctomycetota bacterium]
MNSKDHVGRDMDEDILRARDLIGSSGSKDSLKSGSSVEDNIEPVEDIHIPEETQKAGQIKAQKNISQQLEEQAALLEGEIEALLGSEDDGTNSSGTAAGEQSKDKMPVGSDTQEEPGQEQGGIPKFDLAEQIMAEQRRITSVRRKGPGQKSEASQKQMNNKPDIGQDNHKQDIKSQSDQIIAAIVAEDIERLCRIYGSAGPTHHQVRMK